MELSTELDKKEEIEKCWGKFQKQERAHGECYCSIISVLSQTDGCCYRSEEFVYVSEIEKKEQQTAKFKCNFRR